MARKKVTLPDMPEKFLQCRDLRHAWKTKGWYRETRQLRRVLECMRCGTYRTDEFSRDGTERRSLGYSWPEGYLMKGEGRPTVVDVRLAVLSRVTTFHDREELIA